MNLWQKIRELLGPEPAVDAAIVHGVAHAVAVVDPVLKVVGGLEQHLGAAVAHALEYCARLVEELPPPLEVSHRRFATDPLVHALFASANDIDLMLGRSSALREFLADGSNAFSEDCYALLGMRRNQKTVLGMALHGNVLQADAPRKLLYFSDHALQELSLSEEETRRRLQFTAFDSLVHKFADEQAQQRKARDELHLAWESERASGRGELLPDEKAWRISALEARYNESTAALAPEQTLARLAEWLMTPEQHISLEPCTVTVDSMGVMVEPDPERSDIHTLQCPQLVSRDRRRWIVLLVKLSCSEARDAVVAQEKSEAAMRSLFL